MLLAITLGVACFTVCGAIHFLALNKAAQITGNLNSSNSLQMLVAVHIAAAAHVLEAGVYGLAYMMGLRFSIGEFQSDTALSAMDVLHFSLITYTSLGLGDVVPTNHLRFISGLEALNGFLLISCSASFIFIQMSRSRKKS